MSFYAKYPATGGIATYPNFASLPVSAPDGTLALTLDTDTLYAFNIGSGMWLPLGSPSAVLSIGAIDSQAPGANGATLNIDALIMQSASATFPGLVNNTTQTFSGNKTFTGTIAASNLSGTNTGDVTIGTANGLSIVGQVLSLGLSSTSTTGALSSTDWNTFNNKQTALTLGDLTDAGTDGIVITGGTGAVVGSGTSIAQHVADTTHNGYLSSTDWNTFNSKQAAGNYITALTGDVTATGPGSVAATLATVNGNVGTFGSSTSIPTVTVNAKGLVTAASGNAVIAPAGTLTGTTLNSTVVTSSLTSVGTLTSGTWNATVIAPTYGGAAPVTRVLYVDGNRSDTYTANGTTNLPFKTISAAISQVITNADNSTHQYNILVAPFAYVETLTFNSSLLYNLVISSLTAGSGNIQNTSVSALTSTSNNTQLATLILTNIAFNGAVTVTGDITNTNLGSTQILFNNCQFNAGAVNLTNVNNVNFYNCQNQGAPSSTFTNIAFAYIEGPEGLSGGTTLNLVDNPGGNIPAQYAGNYLLFSESKMYGTLNIDATSECDFLTSYTGSSSIAVNNGTIHSWATLWGGTVTLNNGSTTRTRGDTFVTAPTVNAGATFLYQATGYNDTQVVNKLKLTGATSGTISVLPQAAAGTFNFNLPTTAGSIGQVLTSQGGGSTAMTWSSAASSTLTSAHLFVGNASNVATDVAASGDLTLANTGAFTLNTVNANVGSFTNASITVNAKGLITAASSGTAPVTSISVSTANGLAGTSSGGTTPALTLSTTVTGILQGNGTAISAATTTGTGNVVLSASPTMTGTIAAAALTLSTPLAATSGGTGTGTYTTGDTLYASATNTLSKLPIGSTNQVLTVIGGIPSWQTPSTSVTTIGTFNSQASSANGLVISGANLYAQAATTSNPGMVSIPAAGGLSLSTAALSINVDGSTTKINSNALEALQPNEERITLSGTNITNQFVDLAHVVFGTSASANSITLFPNGGPMQLKTVDYTVSLTGGSGGVTRVTFAGDLATGGAAALIAGDILVIDYSYLA